MTLATISVGIDGSTTSADALAWALGLARSSDATVRALHVWRHPSNCIHPWFAPSEQESREHGRAAIATALEAAGASADVESVIIEGSPGPCLSTEPDDDLLVVGRTGETYESRKPDVGEVTVGASARYCLNHCARPVVSVPADVKWVDAPHVVVGIDGSPNSIAALKWATTEMPANSTIHVVHAIVKPCDHDSTPIDYELLDPLVDASRTELQRLVDTTVESNSRTIHTHVILGSAPDALVDPGVPCDVIVVGEHGDTAAAESVIGSVADHTLRHSPTPVIVVPSPDRP